MKVEGSPSLYWGDMFDDMGWFLKREDVNIKVVGGVERIFIFV